MASVVVPQLGKGSMTQNVIGFFVGAFLALLVLIVMKTVLAALVLGWFFLIYFAILAIVYAVTKASVKLGGMADAFGLGMGFFFFISLILRPEAFGI